MHYDVLQAIIVPRSVVICITVPPACPRLLALCRQTRTRRLLVCHRPEIPAAFAAALTGLEPQVLRDVPAVLGGRDDPTPARVQQLAAEDEDDLPPCSVIRGVAHYRAEMFRRLDPARFARVDAAYRYGFDAACRSLRSHPTSGSSASRRSSCRRSSPTRARQPHPSPRRGPAPRRAGGLPRPRDAAHRPHPAGPARHPERTRAEHPDDQPARRPDPRPGGPPGDRRRLCHHPVHRHPTNPRCCTAASPPTPPLCG